MTITRAAIQSLGTAIKTVTAFTLIILSLGFTHAAAQAPTTELDELRQIRRLLEILVARDAAPPKGPPTSVAASKGDQPVILKRLSGEALGKADAPVTIVEFTDLECPFCRQFHLGAFQQLKKDYIDTGKVRFITRDFPLERIHPSAVLAAQASRCAGEQHQFWEMRHMILVNNTSLSPEAFGRFATDLKLNVETFKGCLESSDRFASGFAEDLADAEEAGISGTPSFVIGRTPVSGPMQGTRMNGSRPIAVYDAVVKQLLSSAIPTRRN